MLLTNSIDLLHEHISSTGCPSFVPKNDTIDCRYKILVSYNFTKKDTTINMVTGTDSFFFSKLYHSDTSQSRWTKYLMFAPLDIFTSAVSPKVGMSLQKHSENLSTAALFWETNLVENCKTLSPKLQKKIKSFRKVILFS